MGPPKWVKTKKTMSAQNINMSASEEYSFFLKHKNMNRPEDVKYVEDSFANDPNFKPYYMVGFDGKPAGWIDNPYTMNLCARPAMGLPPVCPSFAPIDPNYKFDESYFEQAFIKRVKY